MTRRGWIADHARHLAQVLRAQIGQQFDISTGSEVRSGTIAAIYPDRVEFELGESIQHVVRAEITVAISIFKFDRLEWAIEKCTELGVARIIPIIAARTEKRLAEAASNRVDRWRRVAKQAAEQSRRISAPEVGDPVRLGDVLTSQADARIVLSEAERVLNLQDAIPAGASSLALAFGPEGGWKSEELAAFSKAGWTSASLGPSILRAETAAIAAVAISASVLNS